MKASRVFLSGLVVIAATAVVASAADRPKAYTRSAQPRAAAHQVKAPDVVLFDQETGSTGVSIVSQDFTDAGFDAYDALGAGDFVVPSGHTWTIQTGFFPGVYFNGSGPAEGLNLAFFNDAA